MLVFSSLPLQLTFAITTHLCSTFCTAKKTAIKLIASTAAAPFLIDLTFRHPFTTVVDRRTKDVCDTRTASSSAHNVAAILLRSHAVLRPAQCDFIDRIVKTRREKIIETFRRTANVWLVNSKRCLSSQSQISFK
jgi:hypothetical protein